MSRAIRWLGNVDRTSHKPSFRPHQRHSDGPAKLHPHQVKSDRATVASVQAAQPFQHRFLAQGSPVEANRDFRRMFFGHPASLFRMYQKWYIVKGPYAGRNILERRATLRAQVPEDTASAAIIDTNTLVRKTARVRRPPIRRPWSHWRLAALSVPGQSQTPPCRPLAGSCSLRW